jgi:ribosome biogenesis GTPase A
MELQWYPGHMTKARRMMEENLKLIDLLIELADARIPESSRNPDIDALGKGKGRLLLLNKADLADLEATKLWENYYKEQGFSVLCIDSRKKNSMNDVRKIVKVACADKLERNKRKGILNRPLRAMVAGIPNVGKSTFINSFVGKASAKTGNKPGVTKGKQWIRLGKDLELLDTPGILWPKFEDQEAAFRLAAIGSIRAEILQEEELSLKLIGILSKEHSGVLTERYDIDETKPDYEILADIAESRNCLLSGGRYNMEKAAKILLDDFRAGRLGRITLELPVL